MNFFLSLLNAMPGAITQGMLWGIMAIGVYITYRILDVADLTVDGSLATGGAVCVMLMRAGWNPWAALLCAFLAVRDSCHSGRYPHPAGAVLRQSSDHDRQGQPAHRRG